MLAEEVDRKSPEDTLRDIKPYLDEAGVTRIADITGMDRIGIPVYAVIRPDSKSLAVDSGKGVTREQAKCSAAMESIERWVHDEYPIRESLRSSLFSGFSYHFPMVRGAVFNADYPHKWMEATYWRNPVKMMVPYYHVFNYPSRLPLHEMCWQSGTNGLAAGNNRTEAILQGLYEIIERDAVTIWMATGNAHRINKHTIGDEVSKELIAMCDAAGVEACICDVTSNIGVPVYVCVMVDRRSDIGAYKGYGANLNSNIALRRSICEAAQSRAVFLSGGRDDMRWARHVYESQNVSNAERLRELDVETRMPYEARSHNLLSDVDQIEAIEDMLIGNGCGKLIVADIMEREHACVVKVMSEHLEGYWNPYLQYGRRAKR